jgi:hypothetical protein
MAGGILQLVSSGGFDIYLINNPKITFFESVYRKHSNFYKFEEVMYFKGEIDFNRKIRIDISKRGDLLRNMYLNIKLPKIKGKSVVKLDEMSSIQEISEKNVNKIYKNDIILYIISLTFKRFICGYYDDKELANNLNFLHNKQFGKYDMNVECKFKDYYLENKFYKDDDYIAKHGLTINNVTYQTYKHYNKNLIEFKDSYWLLDKNSLISKIFEDYNFGDLEHTIRFYSESLLENVNISNIHSIIKNFEIYEYIINDLNLVDYSIFEVENGGIDDKVLKRTGLQTVYFNKVRWPKRIGHKLIKDIKLIFNGEIIDCQNSDIFDFIRDLNLRNSKIEGYNKMIGNISQLTAPQYEICEYNLIIPLNFWFNKNVRSSLPIFMMDQVDIEIEITFNKMDDDIIQLSNLEGDILCEFINIDESDKQLIRKNQKFTVEFYQRGLVMGDDNIIKLYFKSALKELFWKNNTHNNDMRIELDGIVREDWKSTMFYKYLVPFYHHTKSSKKYNMYSFALYPEKNILSGELFCKDVKQIDLVFKKNVKEFQYYGLFYGILEIIDGAILFIK